MNALSWPLLVACGFSDRSGSGTRRSAPWSRWPCRRDDATTGSHPARSGPRPAACSVGVNQVVGLTRARRGAPSHRGAAARWPESASGRRSRAGIRSRPVRRSPPARGPARVITTSSRSSTTESSTSAQVNACPCAGSSSCPSTAPPTPDRGRTLARAEHPDMPSRVNPRTCR